jgi:hypothetical protein
MIRFIRWTAIAAIFICSCSQMKFEKIPETHVDQTQRSAAEAWAKSDQFEVRMVYNLEGRIDGFWIKPWKDSL